MLSKISKLSFLCGKKMMDYLGMQIYMVENKVRILKEEYHYSKGNVVKAM